MLTKEISLPAMFSGPLFEFEHECDLPGLPVDALTYQRLGHLNEKLAPCLPLVLHDQRKLRELLELTAMVSPSLFMAFFLHHSMAVGASIEYGADLGELAKLEDGGAVGAIMMTELGYGSSSANILTEAHYDPHADDFVLHTPIPMAVKFPSNVGADNLPRFAVVSARLKVGDVDSGVFLFMLRLREATGPCPGVSIKDVQAFPHLQLDYASTKFTHTRLPRTAWLADGAALTRDGVFTDPLGSPDVRTQRTVGVSRFAHGANCLGLAAAARASIAISVSYAQRRQTNNGDGVRRSLIRHRNQQQLLLTGMAAAFAATALARRVGAPSLRISAPRGSGLDLAPSESRAASLAKVGTARLAERAIARARASSGVAGFMARNRLIGYHNFALGFQNAGGDNQMYLLQAARAMIAEAPSAATAWLATPPRAMDTVDDCLELLRHREVGLRAQLSTGLAEAVASGADDFTVWDTNVGSALAFAEAHLVRNVAEHFHLSAVEADDPAERRLLLLLCELLMREEIADHEGWYRAKGVLEASVPHEELAAGIGRICERLLDDLDSLVRMLDVPVPLLHSSATDERYFDRIVPSVSCSGPDGSAELG